MFLINCRHQLETPGRYSHLVAFYEDKKGTLPFGASLPVSSSSYSISNLSSPGSEILPELKVSKGSIDSMNKNQSDRR